MSNARRFAEIDGLRGLMLILMTVTHLPTAFSGPLGQPFGFVSAAEGFVFLSAFLVGTVYTRMAERDGIERMRNALLGRSAKVYAAHLAILIAVLVFVVRHGEATGNSEITNWFSFHASRPRLATVSALVLVYDPPLFDILPMYVLFLALTPAILRHALEHGWRSLLAASVVALFTVLAVAIVLTNWLIARRAAAYRRAGTTDPRRRWVLWVGCLVPVVNMFFAPVFVTEMATTENRIGTLRRLISIWWAIWAVTGLVVAGSMVGMFAMDPQGIADNTEVTVIAYLMGMLSLAMIMRVYLAFERTQADAPARRWVVREADETGISATESAVPAPPTPEEPAAWDHGCGRHWRLRRHTQQLFRGGPPRGIGRAARAHAGRLRAGPEPGRGRPRMRCPADPGRAPGLRARSPDRSDVDRNRSGQRDDAGATAALRFRGPARRGAR